MRHIDIYLLVTYYKKKLHLSDSALCLILSENTGHLVTPDDLKLFNTSVTPNVKSLAKALQDEGLTAKQISEVLDTSIHNVHYYLKRAKDIEYVNPYWHTRFETDELKYQNTNSGVFIK